MTATMTTTHALTREDIAALRGADDVVFHTNTHVGTVIHAELLGRPAHRVYTPAEQRRYPVPGTESNDRRRVIPCDVEIFGMGGGHAAYQPWNHENNPEASGFGWLHYPGPTGQAWPTTAAMLKPGDTLTLRWIADRQVSETLRDARLHVDTLDLLVLRGGRRLVFEVLTKVTGDNSGRMVKRFGG